MDKLNGLCLHQLIKNEEMHLCAKDLIEDTAHLFLQTYDYPVYHKRSVVASTSFVWEKMRVQF